VFSPQHKCIIHTEVKIKLLVAEFLLLSFSELHWTMHFICIKKVIGQQLKNCTALYNPTANNTAVGE
jgi:hypothetical protein